MAYPAHEPTRRLPVGDDLRLTPAWRRGSRGHPLRVQESLNRHRAFFGCRAPSTFTVSYRVTVPVNVCRTGELGVGPYTASLFPPPPSPSNAPVPLTIVHTPFWA